MPFDKSGGNIKKCAVNVSFISFADGIDDEAFRKIESYIEENPHITNAKMYSWGMEGEKDLCIETSKGTEPEVYNDIKVMLPSKPQHGRIFLIQGEQIYSLPGK